MGLSFREKKIIDEYIFYFYTFLSSFFFDALSELSASVESNFDIDSMIHSCVAIDYT